jgi:hypothetical protein
MSFAARTEINVVTDGTLVSNSRDVALSGLILAQRAITEDTKVDLRVARLLTNSFVNRSEAVARVVLVGLLDAAGTVVPVGARQALVAGTDDALLASITNSSVLELTAGQAARHDEVLQAEVAVRAKGEGVGRVVAMLVAQQTAKAEVIILAVIATHKVALIDLTAAPIAHRLLIAMNSDIRLGRKASVEGGLHLLNLFRGGGLVSRAHCDLGLDLFLLLHGSNLFGKLGGVLGLDLRLGLSLTRGNRLGSAVGHDTVHHHPLDQPVTIATAGRTGLDALWAQVVVTIFADTAVIVLVGNRSTTVVAVNAEHAVGGAVRDNWETDLVFSLKVPVARRLNGCLHRLRREGINLERGSCQLRSGREGLGMSHGDGGAEDGLKVTVSGRALGG